MNITAIEVSLLSPMTACLICLAIGALFATLRSAFTLTGRAGVLRLAEKDPALTDRLAHWEPRWDLLRSTLLLVSMIMEVGAIAFSLLALSPVGETMAWNDIAGVFGIVLAFTIALEVLPLALSESYADRLTLTFLPLTILLARVTWILSWPLAKLERRLRTRLMLRSDEEDHPSAEDAIRSLVNEKFDTDLEEEEREIIRSVFEFGETITREIMTPRVDMQGLEDMDSVEDCIAEVRNSPYSRFPIFHESLDDILGVIHVKDLLRQTTPTEQAQPIMKIMKPVPFVPESMPINDLLQLLRTEQAQQAIVVDEYGGTAGLVTVEDVIEELVGEINDEYDSADKTVSRLSDGSAAVDARLPVEEANERLGIHVPVSEEYDSLGGYVFHDLGRIPKPGETLDGSDFKITIQTANARRLHTLRIQKLET